MLAQVWGLGVGVSLAHASSSTASSGPAGAVGRTVRSLGVPAANDAGSSALGVVGEAAGAGSGAAAADPAAGDPAAVDQLLHSRIKAGGLPLPGQATAMPDAFSIAAVLLPAVPPQPGAPAVESAGTGSAAGGRSAHSGAFPVQRGRSDEGSAVAAAPAAWLPGPGWEGSAPAHGAAAAPVADQDPTAALGARSTGTAASRNGERPLVGMPHPLADSAFGPAGLPGGAKGPLGADLSRGQQPVAAAPAASSMQASGIETAVLFPIAAGLLLTGAAMYKHRGLPRGH
ncbi:hypothetical protein C7C46_09075 [Streptomyces tateyamensis]|uniref:Uncharacterized protein n=1 Tax=Streptomyces tateyamensis TaxID=565073 RepID=A0A2V4NGY3_9ACTN|nr:hypothetical protein [Streptomyces tateyamensis]PYC83473.1 hypothetical protein C7C46_09075 [Streptomyces tateyamensis]